MFCASTFQFTLLLFDKSHHSRTTIMHAQAKMKDHVPDPMKIMLRVLYELECNAPTKGFTKLRALQKWFRTLWPTASWQ